MTRTPKGFLTLMLILTFFATMVMTSGWMMDTFRSQAISTPTALIFPTETYLRMGQLSILLAGISLINLIVMNLKVSAGRDKFGDGDAKCL